MTTVVINPGTGPVANATEENAIENIKAFVRECEETSGCAGIQCERAPENDGRGRFGFRLKRGTAEHEVEMPGLTLDRVRYVDDTQKIWLFPRLYVDGSSWVWKFAVLDRKVNWEPSEDGTVES